MATKTISDIDVAGKRVLMRVDFNVPLADGKVTNDKRIVAALPSINKVLEANGSLILMSHLGRPKGQVNPDFSLAPVAARLSELLGREVKMGPSQIAGPETAAMVGGLKGGDVLLLENVRFDPREKSKDVGEVEAFGAELALLGEVYVNDAFGTCHRNHASMWGAPKSVQAAGGPAVAGFLVEKEIKYLAEAVAEPARPFTAILGGAKVSDKIKLVSTLLDKVDKIIIGGGMAFTLLKSQGAEIGSSLLEEDQVEPMKELLARAGDKIVLPCDHVCTDDFANGAAIPNDGVNIPAGLMGLDIGPKSIEAFSAIITASKTVIWNGPMGVFEKPAFATGTESIAKAVADATDAGAVSVIGGGDSAAAVDQMGLADRMTHVSTGGGASLTYLEGKPMGPIEVLDQK
ncbi:MAG: phosphoglycerate kinase [Phycisphaerales bacterium]|jgi:phosphoglycerate kinase|nr:phosphoglycerate kinase [Phycisphaerales bacterium]